MADQTLASLTAATPATGGLIYGTQSGADRKFTLSAAGAAVVESATAADQRTALGLGELATQSGMSVGSTATSGASAGDILTSDGSVVQKMTPGSGVSTAIGNAVNSTGGVLTYGIIGTSGATVPLLDAANTFASGQVFGGAIGDYFGMGCGTPYEMRISSDAFGLGARSILFGMYDSGTLMSASTGMNIYFEGTAGFRGDALFYGDVYWNDGTAFNKPATDHLLFYDKYTNSNACRWSVSNTYTSSTNYEAGVIDWQTTLNVLRIGSDVGSGGGTARDVSVIHGGVEKMHISAVGVAIGTTGTTHGLIKSGTATLTAGAVTVSDSDVVDTGTAATSSRIIVTRMNDGGTTGDSYSITRSNATSFTITSMTGGSAQSADTSTVSWMMLNP